MCINLLILSSGFDQKPLPVHEDEKIAAPLAVESTVLIYNIEGYLQGIGVVLQ